MNRYVINYEATLGFKVEDEDFEITLNQPPGKTINGDELINKFKKVLKQHQIDFEEQKLPELISKSIRTNVINFMVNEEVFFTMDSTLAANMKNTITKYEDKEKIINSQDHNAAVSHAKEMLERFRIRLGEKLGRDVFEEEATHLMANGGILEE